MSWVWPRVRDLKRLVWIVEDKTYLDCRAMNLQAWGYWLVGARKVWVEQLQDLN